MATVSQSEGRPVTVGIDVGTTAVKAVAADPDGRVLARARVPHRLLAPEPGRLEHDAASAWWDGPRTALATVTEQLGPNRVGAVAVAAMVPSLAAVDDLGQPISNGVLYGDERGRGDSVCEDPSRSGEMQALLGWLAEATPAAGGYWPAQAVANRALGGPGAVDFGTAFAAGALFGGELGGDGWDAERCKACGAGTEQLPRVFMFGEPIGETGPERDAVLVAGGVDALCEQLVAGAGEGDALIVCGSTLVAWAIGPADASGGTLGSLGGRWRLPYLAASGLELVGGASNAGGLFLDWVDRILRPATAGELSELEPAGVPVWWPYVRGERVPLHDPQRRAELAGVDLTHGPAALRRAAYEASGFVVRHILEGAAPAPARLVVTGGGSAVGPWMQALADVTGIAVQAVAVPEGAALGAAFLARLGLGLEASLDGAARWVTGGARYEPDPSWREPAEERYQQFRSRVG